MTKIRLDSKHAGKDRIKAKLVSELPASWREAGRAGCQVVQTSSGGLIACGRGGNRDMLRPGSVCYFERDRWEILPDKVKRCFEIQEG